MALFIKLRGKRRNILCFMVPKMEQPHVDAFPQVSIIIPTRNGEKTVWTLLESVMKVDYDKEKLDVIVVDGYSTDRTRELVSEYPVELVMEDGHGLNAARNTGIKHSSGEILIFTDCDCVVPKDWVRKIVENFNDPNIGCVGGTVLGYNADTFSSRYANETLFRIMPSFKTRIVTKKIHTLLYPAGCNMSFRRSVLDKVGLFNEGIRYGFDETELVARVGEAGYGTVLDPEVLIYHRHRETIREILKQIFGYARGSILLIKKRGIRNRIGFLLALDMFGLIVGLSLLGLLITLYFLTSNTIFVQLFLLLVFAPFLLAVIKYALKALKTKNYLSIFTYPFIDALRIIAFSLGQWYQLFKRKPTYDMRKSRRVPAN
jgi:cellulose synthase/poly-beta-1,6-N-acetylglucosamine synthase-like glycosyltransferase